MPDACASKKRTGIPGNQEKHRVVCLVIMHGKCLALLQLDMQIFNNIHGDLPFPEQKHKSVLGGVNRGEMGGAWEEKGRGNCSPHEK